MHYYGGQIYIYIYNDHRSVFYFAGDRFDFWYGATYAKTNPLIRMLHAVSTALQLNHSYIFHHQKENESIKHQMCCFIFQFFKARRMMSPSLICALNVYLFIYIYNVWINTYAIHSKYFEVKKQYSKKKITQKIEANYVKWYVIKGKKVNNKPGSTNFSINPPMWRSPRTRSFFSTCRSVIKIRKFHVLSPTWIIFD